MMGESVQVSRKPAFLIGEKMIRVLLVDDHAYIRKGIRYLLEVTSDIEVVATASNGVEGVARARSLQPDIAIIDLSMPLMSGIEAARQISTSCPGTRVLMLSIYNNREYVQGALEAGARGYVLKDKIPEELLEAIRTLYDGRRYFSQKIADDIDSYIEEDNSSWVG
jgi:DNA-binding NarL/FixJ family response regulator